VSLLLDSGRRRAARDWRAMVLAAMDHGVNCFEIAGAAPPLIEGFTEAVEGIERELLFVAWRPHDFPSDPAHMVESFLTRTGLDYLDLLEFHGVFPDADAITRLRQARMLRGLGLATDDEDTDLLVARGAFRALRTVYSPVSGWKERNRLKAAAGKDMAVIACNAWPESMQPKGDLAPRRSWFRPRGHPLRDLVGGYRFLYGTPGWTPEEICIAYVLTEPAVTTVQVEVDRLDRLARLVDVPDRDLPTGVAAQIEMARFSPGGERRAVARG
jgi:aryl-alcohol dehydrogenase-like predicted oxidoreductase